MALIGTETVTTETASGSVITATASKTLDVALLSGANPARVNTAVATGTGTTLNFAAVIGGVITRTGTSAAFTDTFDTAANIITNLPTNTPLSTSWYLYIRNVTPFNETLAAGTGIALSGETVVPGNSQWMGQVIYVNSASISILGVYAVPITQGVIEANTAITTGSGGTLTAAGIVGGVVTRSGPTSNFSDATDTAANIIAALPNATIGQSWEFSLVNTTAFAETITAGSGVTLSGLSGPISASSTARYLVTYTGSNAVSMNLIHVAYNTASGYDPSTVQTQFGSGTGTALGEGNINRQINAAGINPGGTAADNVLAAYTLPANSFDGVSNRGLQITAMGSFAANGNNKRVKIIFNPASATVGSTVGASGTSVADTGTVTTSGGGWVVSGAVFKYGAANSNTQICLNTGCIAGTTHLGTAAPALATATENANILVAVTGNATTATTDIVFNWLTITAMN
jgi:hypothetical protein